MLILIVVLYALAASSFTIAKAVLSYAQPIFFVGFRMTIAGSLLLAYAYWNNSLKHLLQRKNWSRLFLIIIFHIYLAFVLDLLALQHMSSFKGAFLYNLSPFIAALFSYFYFSERMTPTKWLGLLIGMSGFLPELISAAPQENAQWFHIFFLSTAELLMIGSVIASVIGWIIMRSLVKEHYSVLAINGIGMFAGGLLALLTSLIFERWIPSPIFDLLPFLGLTALIIIIANVLFYNLYGYLLKTYTATFLSFCGFLSPLFAALFGRLFLHEQISWHFFFSIVVVVVGLIMFYQEELRQGYITRKA